ncbi:MAG: hypothetical protein V1757_08210 [Actinomycetota bacterium]|jgi:hypothetical protein
MKTATEMRETAGKTMHSIAGTSKKAALAAVGAPVVAGKRIAGYTGRLTKTAHKTIETWIAEGERITEQLREGKVVEEIKERVDFEQLQGRVEKLRDQLEDVLSNWRESFRPDKAEKPSTEEDQATKPAAKKPAAKKASAAKAGVAESIEA